MGHINCCLSLKISLKILNHIEDSELFNYCNISDLGNRRIVYPRNFLFNRIHLCDSNEDIDNLIITRSKKGTTFHIE